MTYDTTNRGALFKNGQKKSEKHPDYRGELDVSGEKFELAAWLKKSKKGETYMSLSVKPKDPEGYQAKRDNQIAETADVPF